LGRAFPFFLHVDDGLRVLAMGHSLRKACPTAAPGMDLQRLFRVRRPRDANSIETWRQHVGELCTLTALDVAGLTLRGSAELCDDGSLLLLVSPVLGSLDDVARLGLGFNDFAKHDATGDSLLLAQTAHMSSLDAQRLAERLRARTEQMNTMLELSQSGVVYFDARGALQQINSALLALLGLERDAVFAFDIEALDAWIDERLLASNLVRNPLAHLMMANGSAESGLTLHMAGPRGLVLHLVSARTNDGGSVFYVRDVTHETEVDRMKSEFLSTAAHELRTPMVSVFGFTELLLNRPVAEERRREVLQTIHRQSSLLINMVNELLDLARIEARQGKDLRPVPCRLGDLLDHAVGSLMVFGDERRAQVSTRHAEAMLRVDPEKFHRALTNVLSNAFKYSPAGGEISLSTRMGRIDQRTALGVCVQDQGIGMTAEQAGRVFERFFRADPSGNIPGTGLGMSLVKEIIELHGGRVELNSAVGAGTQVTLWLPLDAQPAVLPSAARGDLAIQGHPGAARTPTSELQ
jgi:signal transduction histidine kinase